MAEVGDRVGVLDGSGTTFVGFGTYEGKSSDNALGFSCPKIKMDDGSIKWGFECWWDTEANIRRDFADKIPSA